MKRGELKGKNVKFKTEHGELKCYVFEESENILFISYGKNMKPLRKDEIIEYELLGKMEEKENEITNRNESARINV